MFCINCGTYLSECANFCYNCGQRQITLQQCPENYNKFSYEDLVPYEYDEVKIVESYYGNQRHDYILLKKGDNIGISDEFFNKIYVPCLYKNIEIFHQGSFDYFKAFNGSKYFLYQGKHLLTSNGADEIFIDNMKWNGDPIIYKNFGRYGIITTWPLRVYDEIYQNATIDAKNRVVITLKDGKYGLFSYEGSVLLNRFDGIEFEEREVQKNGTNFYTTKTRCMILYENGIRYEYLKIYEKEINPSAKSLISEGYYIKHMNIFIKL